MVTSALQQYSYKSNVVDLGLFSETIHILLSQSREMQHASYDWDRG